MTLDQRPAVTSHPAWLLSTDSTSLLDTSANASLVSVACTCSSGLRMPWNGPARDGCPNHAKRMHGSESCTTQVCERGSQNTLSPTICGGHDTPGREPSQRRRGYHRWRGRYRDGRPRWLGCRGPAATPKLAKGLHSIRYTEWYHRWLQHLVKSAQHVGRG
jgi:hypothetical protein